MLSNNLYNSTAFAVFSCFQLKDHLNMIKCFIQLAKTYLNLRYTAKLHPHDSRKSVRHILKSVLFTALNHNIFDGIHKKHKYKSKINLYTKERKDDKTTICYVMLFMMFCSKDKRSCCIMSCSYLWVVITCILVLLCQGNVFFLSLQVKKSMMLKLSKHVFPSTKICRYPPSCNQEKKLLNPPRAQVR